MIEDLKEYGPFVYHVSKDRNSVYIHFRNLPADLDHKMRISTHDERERYGYKWQLRLDGLMSVVQKRWSRYFDSPEKLVAGFRKYYDNVQRDKESYQGQNVGDQGGET